MSSMRVAAASAAAAARYRPPGAAGRALPHRDPATERSTSYIPIRTKSSRVLNMDNVNPNIVKLQYAVRGPLVVRALALEKELKQGAKKPFTEVIRANLGDAHGMGQKPITFIRQVIACVAHPELLNCDYPEDVKERVTTILKACGGQSIGAYSQSYGIEMFRQDIAGYIERRDGHPSKWEDVCLFAGASLAIKAVLELFSNSQVDGKNIGVMVPIPQYPLYSATLAEYGLDLIGYYLDEDKNWGLSIKELERALTEGNECSAVRVIVIINPGNPTGQVLTRKNIEDVIKFAHKHKLFVFADEVYQDNVYAKGSKFFSFKKILREMGDTYKDLELASFMSVSKGYAGECGLRGGWVELVNMDPEVQANLYKAISATLCPTTIGQTAVDCIARPPREGEPSYQQWACEKAAVLDSLSKRASMIYETFKTMKGFKCNSVQGAMYVFPKIDLPRKAIEAAKKDKKPADTFYAFRLLEETGICIIPGSGFGQIPGTYHFRTTILPQVKTLKKMLKVFQKFHDKFTKEYQ